MTARTATPKSDSKQRDNRARPGQSSPKLAYLPIIFLAFAIGIPLLIIVVYSFLEKPSQGTGVKWVFTTENYKALFIQQKLDGTTALDTRYLKVLWTSFTFSLITTTVTLILSVPVAMWIATRDARRRTLLVALVTLPFWISVLIRTYGMRQIIADEGPIGKFLGLFNIDWSILYSPPATILGLIYVFLPFMILPIYASAERFDFRLAEAAYDLGAKKLTVVRKIILPAIRPGIISGIALVFIPALGSFLQSDMLGGGKTNMVANVIANNFGQARNWPFGSALAVLLIVLTLLFVLIIQGISQRRGDKVELV
ncbi:MAG: ABC transporter permease [Candidatus Nanopelagicales bacterium]|jgi:spermidine/putrescine transport system permease protein|nr:ABC transporter permease [Candidatus Nanopelagicales bacterium]MDP4667082.1 ABC transporter permease [Candidatus Nanopelagicales bacterium]MDP4895996.1 ABC transporter permease [Candidatus Nanopelagicales bacterium]MDP5050754.1 ABC transporter permease [Candidatus Nanopelagicales bacterium]